MDVIMEELRLHTRDWAVGTGVPPPYHDNWLHDLGTAIIFFFPTLALMVVSLRIWGRWSSGQLGIDDTFVILAMIISIVWTGALFMYQKTMYLGIHATDIPPHDKTPGLIWDYIIQVLYHPVLALVKSSVLFFHLKLGGTKRGVRIAAHSLNTINLSAMVAVFFTTVFQCVPARSFWDKSIENPRCIDNMTFNLFYNGLVIATDVAVLAIPFWVFLGLRMGRRLKVALLGVFFLGFIVTIVSCIRLYFLVRFFNMRYNGVENPDPTYTLGWTTSTIEGNLAIIAASIPSLWPVMRRWFPAAFSKLEEDPEQRHARRLQNPRYRHHDRFHKERYYNRRGGEKNSPASSATAVAGLGIGGSSQRVYYGIALGGGGGGGGGGAGGSQDSGGSFAMSSLGGGGGRYFYGHGTEIRSEKVEEMKGGGIMRTTNVDVAYDDGPLHLEDVGGEEEGGLASMGRIHGAGRDSFRASVKGGAAVREKERR